MKPLSTIEVLGTESIAPSAVIEELPNGHRRGVLLSRKKPLSQEHGSLDFFASEFKG